MHISYKKLAYLLLSAALISSDVKATRANDGDFRNVPYDVAVTIFVNAIGRDDLKTLNALALTNHNFNNFINKMTADLKWKVNFVHMMNSKQLDQVSDPLKNYAIATANNLVAQHLNNINPETLKQLISFYDKFINNSRGIVPVTTQPAFEVYKKLATLGDTTKAYAVATQYFKAQQYQLGAQYAKLANYRAAPNYKKPFGNSMLFLFVNGLVNGNDLDGAVKTLKNYYAKNGLGGPHYTPEEIIQAIPALGQHEEELRKLQKK